MEHETDTQITASDICDALGRKAIADRIGVGITAVSNASVEGKFPAKWFTALREMCVESGIECPERIFSFVQTKAQRGASGGQIPHTAAE